MFLHVENRLCVRTSNENDCESILKIELDDNVPQDFTYLSLFLPDIRGGVGSELPDPKVSSALPEFF